MAPLWYCEIGCISIKWSIENDICPKGERIYFLDPSIRAGGRSENLEGAKAELLREGIIFLIHLFARAILLMKMLKIEETKAT